MGFNSGFKGLIVVLNETFSNVWITQHIDKIQNSKHLVLSQM